MVYRPTARVLTVLELLQARGQMSGQELASRLEVDARTVRRYITTLQDMGIPVESELGREGGYVLRPGYKLPPLMFNDDEVILLALGLKLAKQMGLREAGSAGESALAKIERVLPEPLRERLSALNEVIGLDDPDSADENDEKDKNDGIGVESAVAAALSVAAKQHRQAFIAYQAADGELTTRTIDPYAVIIHNGAWYTVAYCHLRKGKRVFRLDRITQQGLLDTSFQPPESFDAYAYLVDSFARIPDVYDVEVWLGLPLDQARRALPRGLGSLIPQGDGVCFRSSVSDLRAFAVILLGLGCTVQGITPPELRRTLADLTAQFHQDGDSGGAH